MSLFMFSPQILIVLKNFIKSSTDVIEGDELRNSCFCQTFCNSVIIQQSECFYFGFYIEFESIWNMFSSISILMTQLSICKSFLISPVAGSALPTQKIKNAKFRITEIQYLFFYSSLFTCIENINSIYLSSYFKNNEKQVTDMFCQFNFNFAFPFRYKRSSAPFRDCDSVDTSFENLPYLPDLCKISRVT